MPLIQKCFGRQLDNQHLIPSLLIQEEQSGFIKRRCILDSVAAAQEVIFHCKKKNVVSFRFKIDFEKAYDSVSWDCVMKALPRKGFDPRWLRWMELCICSGQY